jgi:hypothetical protein
MSLSIHSTAPAAQAANLEPVPAVKSTSDTKSAAPSQKQAPSQAVVAPSASQHTVQISAAAQTLFRNPRKPSTDCPGSRSRRPSGRKVAREGNRKQVSLTGPATVVLRTPRRDTLDERKIIYFFFSSHPAISVNSNRQIASGSRARLNLFAFQ